MFGITKQDLLECIKAGIGGSLVSCKWRSQPKPPSSPSASAQLGGDFGKAQIETGESEQVHIDAAILSST